jgi:hypothetical protein
LVDELRARLALSVAAAVFDELLLVLLGCWLLEVIDIDKLDTVPTDVAAVTVPPGALVTADPGAVAPLVAT